MNEKAIDAVAEALRAILRPESEEPSVGMVFRARQIVGALEKEDLLK